MRVYCLPVNGPRKLIRTVSNTCIVSSYDESRVVELSWPTLSIVREVSIPHPRDIVLVRRRMFVTSYGNPMGKLVCVDLNTFDVLFEVAAWRPRGMCLWRGLLYVTEVKRNRVAIYQLNGKRLGCLGGPRLCLPRGICVHRGLLLIADSGSHRVLAVHPRTRKLCWTYESLQKVNDVCSNGRTICVSQWNEGVLDITNRRRYVLKDVSQYTMISTFHKTFYVCGEKNFMFGFLEHSCNRNITYATQHDTI